MLNPLRIIININFIYLKNFIKIINLKKLYEF